MSKFTKGVSILLAMIMLCAVYVPQKAFARPKTFHMNWIGNAEYPSVRLTIEDMNFYGKIRPGYNEAQLDKMIQETLSEMGLSEEEFDRLNEPNRPLTQQEVGKIRDALLTAVKVAVPALGTAADTLKAIEQCDKGDYSGMAMTILEMPLGVITLPRDIVLSLQSIYQFATNTAGPVHDFYRALKKRIGLEKFGWVMEFKNATSAKMPFTLFGSYCTEQWTLNMTLVKKNTFLSDRSSYIGDYEGSYTIDIDYDLSNFQSKPLGITEKGEIAQTISNFANSEWYGTPIIDVVSNGACDVRRTLAGDATAEVNNVFADSITPSQKRDEKKVSVSGIKISMKWAGISGDAQFGTGTFIDLSSDNPDNFTAFFNSGYSSGSSSGFSDSRALPDWTTSIPWEGTIWERGDKARQGWKLKVVGGGGAM